MALANQVGTVGAAAGRSAPTISPRTEKRRTQPEKRRASWWFDGNVASGLLAANCDRVRIDDLLSRDYADFLRNQSPTDVSNL